MPGTHHQRSAARCHHTGAVVPEQMTHHHIAEAADTLAATSGHCLHNLGSDQFLITMSDLASIAGLLGELATQTRRQLAACATVDAHLQQAEQQAADLRRCLNNACAAFAFSNVPPTAA